MMLGVEALKNGILLSHLRYTSPLKAGGAPILRAGAGANRGGIRARDQLPADKASRLKSALQIAADQCIPEFARKVLGITG